MIFDPEKKKKKDLWLRKKDLWPRKKRNKEYMTLWIYDILYDQEKKEIKNIYDLERKETNFLWLRKEGIKKKAKLNKKILKKEKSK